MDIPVRISQARLIARELWTLMREDASHRLGIAQSMPETNDRIWSPDFYHRCQLAERLFAILDEIAIQDGPAGGKAEAQPNQDVIAAPCAASVSRRRFGI